MKPANTIAGIVLLALVATGCASSRPYFTDRGRDAADILTATVGIGVGTKARLGPLQIGLLAQADGLGLRGGTFPDVSDNSESWFVPNTVDLQFLAVGGETLDTNDDVSSARHKDFAAESVGPFFHPLKDRPCPSYYAQIEVVVALIPSLRLGLNPAELLDFLVGWGGLDLLDDDLESVKKVAPAATGGADTPPQPAPANPTTSLPGGP